MSGKSGKEILMEQKKQDLIKKVADITKKPYDDVLAFCFPIEDEILITIDPQELARQMFEYSGA